MNNQNKDSHVSANGNEKLGLCLWYFQLLEQINHDFKTSFCYSISHSILLQFLQRYTHFLMPKIFPPVLAELRPLPQRSDLSVRSEVRDLKKVAALHTHSRSSSYIWSLLHKCPRRLSPRPAAPPHCLLWLFCPDGVRGTSTLHPAASWMSALLRASVCASRQLY